MSAELEKNKTCSVASVKRPEHFVKPRYQVKSEEGAYELFVVMPGVAKEDVNQSQIRTLLLCCCYQLVSGGYLASKRSSLN